MSASGSSSSVLTRSAALCPQLIPSACRADPQSERRSRARPHRAASRRRRYRRRCHRKSAMSCSSAMRSRSEKTPCASISRPCERAASCLTGGDRRRIAIDGENARAGHAENGLRIAAGTEGRIEEDFARLWREGGENVVTKHGKVAGQSACGESVFAAARYHSRAPCDRGPSGAA